MLSSVASPRQRFRYTRKAEEERIPSTFRFPLVQALLQPLYQTPSTPVFPAALPGVSYARQLAVNPGKCTVVWITDPKGVTP